MAAAAGRLNRPPAPQEGRRALARKIFHGRAGQLHRHYQEGMEDQIGALGLVLNALVLFNTRYMDADVVQLCAEGFDAQDTCSPCTCFWKAANSPLVAMPLGSLPADSWQPGPSGMICQRKPSMSVLV